MELSMSKSTKRSLLSFDRKCRQHRWRVWRNLFTNVARRVCCSELRNENCRRRTQSKKLGRYLSRLTKLVVETEADVRRFWRNLNQRQVSIHRRSVGRRQENAPTTLCRTDDSFERNQTKIWAPVRRHVVKCPRNAASPTSTTSTTNLVSTETTPRHKSWTQNRHCQRSRRIWITVDKILSNKNPARHFCLPKRAPSPLRSQVRTKSRFRPLLPNCLHENQLLLTRMIWRKERKSFPTIRSKIFVRAVQPTALASSQKIRPKIKTEKKIICLIWRPRNRYEF